jgi:hypothetical protein
MEQQVITTGYNTNPIVGPSKIILNKQPILWDSDVCKIVTFLDNSISDTLTFEVEKHRYGPFNCKYNTSFKSLVRYAPLLIIVLDCQCITLPQPLPDSATNKQNNKLSMVIMYFEFNKSTVQPNCVTFLQGLPAVILMRKHTISNEGTDASVAQSTTYEIVNVTILSARDNLLLLGCMDDRANAALVKVDSNDNLTFTSVALGILQPPLRDQLHLDFQRELGDIVLLWHILMWPQRKHVIVIDSVVSSAYCCMHRTWSGDCCFAVWYGWFIRTAVGHTSRF